MDCLIRWGDDWTPNTSGLATLAAALEDAADNLAWTCTAPEVEALPEIMHGRYASLLIEPRHVRLDIDWMHSELEVGKIWQLPGTNDERAELLIDSAKIVTAAQTVT